MGYEEIKLKVFFLIVNKYSETIMETVCKSNVKARKEKSKRIFYLPSDSTFTSSILT